MSKGESRRDEQPRTNGLSSSENEEAIARALADYFDRQARDEFVDVEAFLQEYQGLEKALLPFIDAIREIDEANFVSLSNSAHSARDPLPDRLSGHKVLGEIGAGGMGRVLLAYDERLNRKVAVKVLGERWQKSSAIRVRFMQEAKALAQVSHPHIVTIHSLGAATEMPHFVMEYVNGVDLLTASRPLTLAQRAELMCQVALAVEVLHQHHILHRDLKPANIMVGPDLQPKLLDFGLARHEDARDHLTLFGEMLGTPNYFSPEQTNAGVELDARSDIFSLGIVLYELLTQKLPFEADSLSKQIERIRSANPVLPRRVNPDIPGDLQDICLKALEKNPADRYRSAGEMADDLERFLAGEKVHANPTTYGTVVASKIGEHLREIEGWRRDEVLSEYELDVFRRNYGRLVDREDAWILEARRLTLPQVTLYLGAWVLTVGAALLFLFQFLHFPGKVSVLMVAAVTSLILWAGIRIWRGGQLRIGIAFLLTFCLLLPTVVLLSAIEYKVLDLAKFGMLFFYSFLAATHLPKILGFVILSGLASAAAVSALRIWRKGPLPIERALRLAFFLAVLTASLFGIIEYHVFFPQPADSDLLADLEAPFRPIANVQLWWAIWLSMPAYVWLRRFTRSSVFSLVFAIMAALLSLVTLLRFGLLPQFDKHHGWLYFRLIPIALLFFLVGVYLERRRLSNDSRYFYPLAVFFTFAALSGLAADHKPYQEWLNHWFPWTRGQAEYLFMANAGIYFVLQTICSRFPMSQMRAVAKAFRFVIPGHILTSMLSLGIRASDRWHKTIADLSLKHEARAFEILLPILACVFVYASIPKQMKNYFVTGALFLAIGIVRLQQDMFEDRALWSVILLAFGLLLMLAATRYSSLKLKILRGLSRFV
jgi:hypothetical protein